MSLLETVKNSLNELSRGDPEAVTIESPATTRPGGILDVSIVPDRVVAAAQVMRDAHMVLDCITGVDWLAEQQFEIVYDFFHFEDDLRVVLRLRIPREGGAVESIQAIYQGANWHEREAYDFFGILFTNHPDLTRILLPEDADYFPLKKDYQP